MKKMFSLVLALSLLLSLSTTGYAAVEDDCNNITIDVSEEHLYYDEELGTNVVAFTINSDGTVNYLSKEEADAITAQAGHDNNIEQHIIHDIDESSVRPYDYRQWYEFVQTSGPTKYVGSVKKVSADLEAPAGGGAISKDVSYTSTHFFSASITTTSQKNAIEAGASIGWEKSASTSTTYTVNLLAGQKGYIGFYPYYNKVVGDLELYGNWGDGLISTTKNVAGYSVMLTDDGEADGLFKFIEVP